MNVGEMTNEQLHKAIVGRLTSGELDLLMREAGRRGMNVDLAYEEYRGHGQKNAVSIATRVRFQPMTHSCED